MAKNNRKLGKMDRSAPIVISMERCASGGGNAGRPVPYFLFIKYTAQDL